MAKRTRRIVKSYQPAAPEAVEQWVADAPTEFLVCRALNRHAPTDFTATPLKGGGFEVVLRCTRCRTLIRQTWDRQGTVIAAESEYPDGYLLPPGSGRVDEETRPIIRQELMGRWVDARKPPAPRKAAAKARVRAGV